VSSPLARAAPSDRRMSLESTSPASDTTDDFEGTDSRHESSTGGALRVHVAPEAAAILVSSVSAAAAAGAATLPEPVLRAIASSSIPRGIVRSSDNEDNSGGSDRRGSADIGAAEAARSRALVVYEPRAIVSPLRGVVGVPLGNSATASRATMAATHGTNVLDVTMDGDSVWSNDAPAPAGAYSVTPTQQQQQQANSAFASWRPTPPASGPATVFHDSMMDEL